VLAVDWLSLPPGLARPSVGIGAPPVAGFFPIPGGN